MTLPARGDEDIDADEITKKVAKSSGANYSFHKEKSKGESVPDVVVNFHFQDQGRSRISMLRNRSFHGLRALLKSNN